MIQIGEIYQTNKGYKVKIVRLLKTGYYLATGPDNNAMTFDRKGVSVMYVDLFLML